ncbi:uncharacterized protein TNCV_3469151 [Trichonephila clavipes]|nr:uncharacterized protein TNCV_3469151 [Trichonephila clavipes]
MSHRNLSTDSELVMAIEREIQDKSPTPGCVQGRAQSSIMMHPVSTTQVSSMAETTQTNHHGLHYRTKSGDKHLDIATSVTEANAFEDVTLV